MHDLDHSFTRADVRFVLRADSRVFTDCRHHFEHRWVRNYRRDRASVRKAREKYRSRQPMPTTPPDSVSLFTFRVAVFGCAALGGLVILRWWFGG